jgi:hypothetical protein
MSDNESLVRRHDKFQFEVKLAYDLKPPHRREHYRVETFFFLPENLDVNESTYSKNQFYRDLLLYIRFRTPDFSLASLIDPDNDRSPIAQIRWHLDHWPEESPLALRRRLDYEIRLLGCVARNTLREHARRLESALKAETGTAAAAGAEHFLDGARRLAASYRALRTHPRFSSLPASLAATYAFVDEYISLLIEGRCHILLQFIQSQPADRRPMELHARLGALADDETDLRRRSGYPSVVEPRRDNETFVFRLSVLKKFVTSALHLSVHTEEDGRGWEHVVLAVAAGIAMLFATSVAFYYQKTYGTLSLSFFGAVIVSYMFKDRIKALLQSWLQKRLSQYLFDQETEIIDPLNDQHIGLCRELMGFVPEVHVDPVVRKIRNRDHITEIENSFRSERVIHYVKDITLYTRRFLKHHTRKTGVTDILRFNVRNFLLKMDEPVSEVFTWRDGRSEAAHATRVYHVNIVIKLIADAETRYDRIRLVLTQQGIKRIEPVSTFTRPNRP